MKKSRPRRSTTGGCLVRGNCCCAINSGLVPFSLIIPFIQCPLLGIHLQNIDLIERPLGAGNAKCSTQSRCIAANWCYEPILTAAACNLNDGDAQKAAVVARHTFSTPSICFSIHCRKHPYRGAHYHLVLALTILKNFA